MGSQESSSRKAKPQSHCPTVQEQLTSLPCILVHGAEDELHVNHFTKPTCKNLRTNYRVPIVWLLNVLQRLSCERFHLPLGALGGSGTFKRWGLVRGLYAPGDKFSMGRGRDPCFLFHPRHELSNFVPHTYMPSYAILPKVKINDN